MNSGSYHSRLAVIPPAKFVKKAIHHAAQLESRSFAAWNARVDRRISLTVGAALMVLGLGDLTSKVHIKLAIYAVLAQVLPILLLAVVVEGRYFRGLDRRESFDRFLLRGLLYMPMLGEAAALVCVAQGRDSELLRGTALFALGVTVMLLLLYASYGPATDRAMKASAVATGVERVKAANENSTRRKGEGVGL
jgi:hypothetical protein